jgi:hypothetical protein
VHVLTKNDVTKNYELNLANWCVCLWEEGGLQLKGGLRYPKLAKWGEGLGYAALAMLVKTWYK